MSAEPSKDMQIVADAFLALARKRVVGRHDRVVLLARALRRSLNELPIEDRSPAYVSTGDDPKLDASSEKVMAHFWRLFEIALVQPKTRVIVLERATQLAIDDLSPDERIRALRAAKQIIESGES
jgi:hypothetical protein